MFVGILPSPLKMLLSGLAYRYKCGGCNGTHYGKTKRHFETRISEHLGISHPTGKKIKIESSKLSAIQEHLLLQLLSILWRFFYFDQGKY